MNSSALTRCSSAKIPTAMAKILANVQMTSCASISVFIYCSYVKHEGDDYLRYLGANSNKYDSKVASQELEPSKTFLPKDKGWTIECHQQLLDSHFFAGHRIPAVL